MADWSIEEVHATVRDYFAMLAMEMRGERYVKAQHNRDLRKSVNRSRRAIEDKHQNISAILVSKGLPYVVGYQPYGHYQALLESAIEEYLARNPGVMDAILRREQIVPEQPIVPSTDIVEEPPEPVEAAPAGQRQRVARKYDFPLRDHLNRQLGLCGERFVVEFERRRLTEAGKSNLARQIVHVSETQGDGAGYDILSFEATGQERFIEAKTTNFGKSLPFYVSANELEFSREKADRFRLYRLFDFSSRPRLFELPGPLDARCRIDPVQFRVQVGRAG